MTRIAYLFLMPILYTLVVTPVSSLDESRSCPQLFPGAKPTGSIHAGVVGMIVNSGILHQRKFTIVDKDKSLKILRENPSVLFTYQTLYEPQCGFEFSIEGKGIRIIGYFDE